MLRGNGGQPIFFDDEDRCRFCLLLQEGTERFGYRVHGFCLMGNHVHLALQVAERPLAQPMQNLSFRYTRWINRRQRRIGHLFQGRYRALLVEQDSYLLELVRYIHLNPVRANLVTDPAEYRWSGHRAYLDEDRLPWLTTEWVLSQFGQNPRAAIRATQTGAASLTAVAQYFGRDVATLGTGVRRLTLRVGAGEDHHAPWREPIQEFGVKL